VLSELVDQDFFYGVGGLVFIAEGGAEMIELGGIFAGQDELLGVQTVLEGVLRGTQFSDDTLGSCTVLGVGAICFRAASRLRHMDWEPAKK